MARPLLIYTQANKVLQVLSLIASEPAHPWALLSSSCSRNFSPAFSLSFSSFPRHRMSVYKKMHCRFVAMSLLKLWHFLAKGQKCALLLVVFWHFDTPDKTRNYQKDRKRQSDKSFKVSKYHVIWYFPKLGLTLAATPASPFLASMPAHLCALLCS